MRSEFQLLLSVPLTYEYETVLLRPEQLAASGLTAEDVEQLLLSILDVAIQIQTDDYRGPHSVDPGDNHVLQLVAYGEADAIVSYNTRHFVEPCRLLGVSLYQPGQALELIRS
jgi:predicted nucleic acid-binding protein